MSNFEKTLKDIKKIKIQGASNVAIAGLKAIIEKARDFNSLKKAAEKLKKVRPTEPLLFNYLNLLLDSVKNSEDLKKEVKRKVREFTTKILESKEIISEKASKLIKDGDVIFTICHSSTVLETIKKAAEEKEVSVINLETRPLFQGRITSRELSKLGIKNIHIIDSAGINFLPSADIVLTGADAINEKFYVNKIGTLNLAVLSKMLGKKFYILTDVMKYSEDVKIEFRSPKEVWKNAPKGVEIINPAFDKVPTELISYYVTQKGKTRPENIKKAFEKYRGELA